MEINLREYQIRLIEQGSIILKNNKVLYLSMETRTGKTLTALNICNMFNNVLFVTKKKAIKSIEHDFKSMPFNFNLTVINYESVHTISGQFDCVVCDEAHSLGAMPKPAKRVKDLLRFTIGKPIIYLSATPCPETWSQLYHQFYLSSYSPFKQFTNFYKWSHAYVNIKKKYVYNKEINDYTDANKDLIWRQIKHLFLTQTQVESGFEIGVKEEFLVVPMPDELKVIIKALMTNNIYKLDNDVILADTAVKVLQKVHQVSSGTVITESGEYAILSPFKALFLSKWGVGKKLVIFYKFKSEFDMLKEYFTNWTADAFEFQNNPDSTFLGQFQSAREGIRLDSADAIVFFNIDFSYLSYEQARNRIASFERKDKAVLYWLFSDKGIERKIYKAVKNKKNYDLITFKNEGIDY